MNSLLTSHLLRTPKNHLRAPSFDIIMTPDSTITATNPAWIVAFSKRVQQLLDLADNWDGEGARALNVSCVMEALEFLFSVMSHDLPEPQVVPTSEGGLQLEWHINGSDVEIEFDPKAGASFFLSRGSGPEVEGRVDEHALFVSTVLRTLRALNDRPVTR